MKDEEEVHNEIVVAQQQSQQIKAFKVDDDASCVHASQAVKEVSEKIKEIEKRRKRLIAPALQTQREINALFKDWKSPYEEINSHLRRELVGYEQRKDEQRQLAAAEARKQAMIGAEAEVVKDLIEKSVEASPKVAGVSFTSTWKAQVVDFSQLPDEFKVVDEAKLRKYARENQGNKPIPGVQFFLDKKVRA